MIFLCLEDLSLCRSMISINDSYLQKCFHRFSMWALFPKFVRFFFLVPFRKMLICAGKSEYIIPVQVEVGESESRDR